MFKLVISRIYQNRLCFGGFKPEDSWFSVRKDGSWKYLRPEKFVAIYFDSGKSNNPASRLSCFALVVDHGYLVKESFKTTVKSFFRKEFEVGLKDFSEKEIHPEKFLQEVWRAYESADCPGDGLNDWVMIENRQVRFQTRDLLQRVIAELDSANVFGKDFF